jgi:hypothetical protein
MTDGTLAAGLAAGGHSGAGAAVMFAVLGLAALAGYAAYRWQRRRDHSGDDETTGRS